MNKKSITRKPNQQLVNPDRPLWRQVKVAAIMEEKTMTQWVEEACRTRLALTEKSKKEVT